MNNYFKTTISYPLMDIETGVTKRKKVSVMIDAINYHDAEVSTQKIIDYFHLNKDGDNINYKLDKIKVANLILDTNNSVILKSKNTDEEEDLNFLSLVSETPRDVHSSGDGWGIYKASYNWVDLATDKTIKDVVNIVTSSLDNANGILKKYLDVYCNSKTSVVTGITQDKTIESLLISEEALNGGIEVFNITQNKH